MVASVIPLKCSCNNYDWGKRGGESLAARLAQKHNPEFKLDDGTDYSEMWTGTYPELPAYSLESGEDLQQIINANTEKLLGKPILDKFGTNLPFLPKILSIKKALPLQIHPSIPLAKKLHQEDPEKFSDENHKPEIAIALSKFELFVGWKPPSEIRSLFSLPPLHHFVSPSTSTFDESTLRSITHSILTAPEATIASVQTGLSSLPKSSFGSNAYILDLLPRLQAMYSKSDPGALIALLCMNYLVLSPGDALFVPEDGIHAYLEGDLVECMARSNNMLATGFCPKADRDNVEVFTNALTFKQQGADAPKLGSVRSEKSKNGKTKAFKPPMSEFQMLVTELKEGETETVSEIKGPSVMMVVRGNGIMNAEGKEFDAKEGSVFFIGQGVQVELEGKGKGDEGDAFQAYRAYAE